MFAIVTFLTFTSEINPPYLWHKPQKSAETQSFSPLISNIQQGNNDFVYVSALEKILNSPLDDSREAYAVFDKGTLTFYFDDKKPVSGAYPFGNVSEKKSEITKVVFHESFLDYLPSDLSSLFAGYENLKEIVDMEKYLNTTDVTNMYGMFAACESLLTINLMGFSTQNVTENRAMFMACVNLTTILVDGEKWSTQSIPDSYNDNFVTSPLFDYTPNLIGNAGTKYNHTHIDIDYAHIDEGESNPGYLTTESYKVFYDLDGDGKIDDITTVDWENGATPPTSFAITNTPELPIPNPINKKGLKFKGWYGTPITGLTKDKPQTDISIPANAVGNRIYTAVWEEKAPYAVFDNGTLTFYYDNNKANFDGAYGMRTTYNDKWSEVASDITKVVFDKSFADYYPTSCVCWFLLCHNLTEIQGMKEYLNTENVTNMSGMFSGKFTALDLSNFKTEKVTKMDYMFANCENLTTLDLSYFSTKNVTNMEYMFLNSNNLRTIYVGDNWTTSAVTSSENMFNGCTALIGGKGSSINEYGITDATYANIDDPENGKPGYFTKSGEQPWAPVSIDLTTLPNKTEYNIGDNLNLDGGELTATFPDNSTKTASLSNAKVSGFDNTKIDEQTITVTWLGKETSFTVTIKEDTREVDWVGTNTAILLGTPFESIWMDVRYKNGDWERKTLSDSQVNVTGLNTDVAGVQNVTITYRGCVWNATFEVYKPIASFDFSIVNTNLNLNANEKLSGFVTVTNEDGTTYEVDVNQMSINIYHETEGYWSLYAIDNDNAYDKTLGEHEFKVVYRNHEANLKYTFYKGPAPAKPYVILADKTITFYSGETIPEGAIELQPSYYFNTPWAWGDYETVVFDESFKNYKPTSTASWFSELASLKEIKGLENLNTEKVTDMQYMFYYCSNIESLDLSGFDVSNVTNMDAMFNCCDNLHTIFVGDNWNLSDYLSSNNMFEGCYSLYGEQGSMPESYKVYDASMARIDGGDNAPGYFTKKGNSKATVTSIDFAVNPYSEHTLGEPINRQSGILNVYFNNREAQQLPYNNFNITPSGYDSTRVGKQTVTVKFLNATTTYEVNVTAKDTSYAHLDDNGVLTLYYGEYKQGAILFGSNNRFNNPGDVKKVVIDKSFANYHPTTCFYWFEYFYNMTEIKGLENLNTQYVTDMSRMFNGCSSLTTLDVSNFKTDNVMDMSSMFYGCSSLTTLDVSNFNTDNVTSMFSMFTNCSSLTTLDLSNFKTENVTSMNNMFYGCSSLQTIYVGDNWTTKNVTESANMFYGCTSLIGGKGTTYDENFIDATYANIDDLENGKPGYFTKVGEQPVPAFVEGEYRITNADELLWFANYVNSGNPGASARLMNDIVLNENLLDKVSKGETQDLITWIPIGTPENPYNGYFRTDSCSISGLYVNNPEQDYVGLFGYYKSSAQHISIKDSYFAGHDYVGGIIGYNGSTNDLESAYFRGTISGNDYVGGITGYTESFLRLCYVVGRVSGNSNAGAIGGGRNDESRPGFSNCYYDNSLTSLKAFGFTGADDAENNISGKNSKSFHNGEVAYLFGFYQDLSDENSYPEFTGKYVHKNLDGNGYHNPEYEDNHCKYCIHYTYTLPQKVDGVYQISNADELYGFMHLVNSGNTDIDAVLTDDIVVNKNVLEKVHNGNTTGLREWYSIGNNGYMGYLENNCEYDGMFDGQFHTISGLYFDSEKKGLIQLGLFESINNTVRNVIIEDTYFKGKNVCGIGYGRNYSIVENCIFDGELFGQEEAAGICYYNNGRTKNCINYGKISGSWAAGIVNGGGFVTNCYNAGEIVFPGDYGVYIGGISSGTTLGNITNCYNTGVISYGYSICGAHFLGINISNTYNNQDICDLPFVFDDWYPSTITGGGNTTTAELCNGKLPEGFSSEDWIAGKTEIKDGKNIYTFPHLKVFEGIYPAYTIEGDAEPVAIKVVKLPNKIEYIEGEKLDTAGCKVSLVYADESTMPANMKEVTFSEIDAEKLGEQTITATYGDLTSTFTVTVVAKSVASISVTKSPEKLTYKKGEVLSVDDGEITVTYNNQTTEILAFTAEGVTISDIDNSKLGAQSITVTYSEKVATFNITVVPDKEILSITISKLPKTEYFAGEDLNISDGELTITYSDKTTETVKLSIAKLSGFNSETVGKQTIKVTYLEKETTFEVNVKAVEIVSIELTTAPTKLEYIENEEFSAEGGEITVTFNNEATQKVALTDEKVSISGFDNTKIGEQTLKVVYNEKETTFDVKVIAKSLEKIAILTQPAKVEYLEGEEFSAEGGEFVAYYNNNSSDTLELGKATVSGFDNTKIGEQVLKVVYNEKTAEIKVTVSAKPEPVVENPYTKPELKDGFYQISTAEELLWFVFDVNSGDTKANAALTNDIVINQDCLERVIKLLGISKADGDLTVWQPIGTFEHAFAGIFDGQGHSISGLFINDKTLDNAGLFGAIASEAVVKNLGVVDSYISGGKNVGAICGQSEGKIENCYSLSEVKGTENVNGIAGKVETVSNVENCYYLADIPNADDPQAKTAAEFKSGEVAQLLAKGGEAWKNVKELPGVESVVVPEPEPQIENPDNPETATEDITLSSVKIWSFEKTIFVENAVNEIVIIDLTGRVVKNVAPDSNRMEIQLSKGGIFIVKTGLSTKKVSVK